MRKLIGSREFYRTVAMLALPLLLQNAITTFVNLLDNLMVGRIGTEAMSGVSIALLPPVRPAQAGRPRGSGRIRRRDPGSDVTPRGRSGRFFAPGD